MRCYTYGARAPSRPMLSVLNGRKGTPVHSLHSLCLTAVTLTTAVNGVRASSSLLSTVGPVSARRNAQEFFCFFFSLNSPPHFSFFFLYLIGCVTWEYSTLKSVLLTSSRYILFYHYWKWKWKGNLSLKVGLIIYPLARSNRKQ